ncbi:hypothetical protein BKA70DRAFT_1307602 [Coprinopsis sp. MPI-PUGE-AT-0042]|nr:hypothetical protein BKA70DRAFT_1307602 [Coprinopsis sp. MPI-PUGE-AT-0042]
MLLSKQVLSLLTFLASLSTSSALPLPVTVSNNSAYTRPVPMVPPSTITARSPFSISGIINHKGVFTPWNSVPQSHRWSPGHSDD